MASGTKQEFRNHIFHRLRILTTQKWSLGSGKCQKAEALVFVGGIRDVWA